ncbi:aminotransferase class I/II-fold pyridoxal phosphate-dependent enzyme [Pseudodesulfovibrio cashew]|uniref:Aminotransferase class I/II-fold pyridoxal phosphate-dependent enzyme n=1 Tax=Pseudodesulfovibrio cashew TaxID=2678688 RepID=A0A6I6JKR4_9BACT|nr:DegT/DnrJ/EryC1/StrS family aminotransferase [Pseudodesulfovibrio cashew]QGY40892.1 aminotransferase class I/II-fold pyridoxal phosphate-dependent enzyme [Pseudodesulfovibrio cashew]
MKVEFYRHNIGQEEIEAITETLQSVFLTTGPKTRQFEADFAAYLGAEHCLGTTSCTISLFLALQALGIGPGDEVIVPAMTFIATANAVEHCGATPVFVDSEPLTGNMDAALVEVAITENTKAIIPVHLYGQMADMKAIAAIANRHGLDVIEDCAHCVEGQRDGYKPGELSTAACFSFYATKNITCGEGGAIVTNDSDLADKMTALRLHGMSKSAADRYTAKYQHWDMPVLGWKANMFDIQAALLIHQLKIIEDRLQRKEHICSRYESAFSEAGVEFPAVLDNTKHARHLFTVWAPLGKRDDMLSMLQEREIGVAVNFRAIHLLDFYKQKYGCQPGMLPVAERIGDRTLTIPMYARMTDDQIEYVIKSVIEINNELK